MSDTGGSRPASDRPGFGPTPGVGGVVGPVVSGTAQPPQITSGGSGVVNAVGGAGATAQAQAAAGPPDPVYGRWGRQLIEAILATIRKRESGGRYNAKNPSSSASGAYQFIDSTWHGFGGYRRAVDAPPEVQDAKARQDVIRILDAHNGDISAVPQFWYYPAGYGKPNLKPPGANTLTMGQYTAAWMKTFNEVTGGTSPAIPTGGGGGGGQFGGSGASGSFGAAPGAATQGVGPSGPGTTVTVGNTAVTVASARPALPANATPDQVDQYIRDNFGAMAWMLDNPELADTIRRAAREQWDDTRLQSALANTHWYKTHSSASRDFDILRHTDPQTAEQQLADRAGQLQTQARQLGIDLTPDRARQIAEQGLTLGWGDFEWTSALNNEFHYNRATVGGQAAQYDMSYRQLASQYGLKLDDNQIGFLVTSTLNGTGSQERTAEWMRQQAASKYSFWSDQILNGGMTPLQLASQYMGDLADTLELNPASITLDHPYVKAALGQIDPKTHQASPMSRWEFEQWLRGRPEYQHTKGAHDQVDSLGSFITQHFGATA